MGRSFLRERRADVAGIEMRWLEAGAGVPVVMVHGIPTSAELWRRVVPRVARAGRAIAWEMVGYGDSIPAGRGRDISIAGQASHLIRWLEALGLDRPILVGHDLGGGVVQTVAVRRPVCAGLVLTNAIGYDAWPVWPVRLVQRVDRLIGRVPATLVAPAFKAVLSRMHAPALGPESARIHWSHYARHDGPTALARQARALDPGDTMAIAPRLPELSVPTRVVWGDADPFLGMALARRLARDLGTEVRPIPGGGHFTPEDHSGPIADAIMELVDRL